MSSQSSCEESLENTAFTIKLMEAFADQVIYAESHEEAAIAIKLAEALANQTMIFEAEYCKAAALNNAGFLTEDDIVWTVAAGPYGAETIAYGEFAGRSIGIDPLFPDSETVNNCCYIDKTVEDVIKDLSVPRPTYVVSNKYSGISKALPEILEMETEPTCVLSPCSCEKCKKTDYANNMPKSRHYQENFPDMCYTDIDEITPAHIDALDLAKIGKEHGYGASVFGLPVNNKTVYMVTITKNPELLNFMNEKGAHFLIS